MAAWCPPPLQYSQGEGLTAPYFMSYRTEYVMLVARSTEEITRIDVCVLLARGLGCAL